MASSVTLTSGADAIFLGEGPVIKINGGANQSWNDLTVDGSGGVDVVTINESTTKTSYFTFSMSNDGVVTFTSASGSSSKYVKFVNVEQLKFWDVTMNLGTAGNDTLTGSGSGETIYGFTGNDRIDGGLGTDKMFGGLGDDTYVISALSDVISELSGEGTDTIESSLTYSLADTDGTGSNGGNVENLLLTGAGNINGTGNGLANLLTGNSGNNVLDGGDGNDTLDGALGVDSYAGGLGNDTFIVDQTSEVIAEAKGAGKDAVKSSVDFTLATNIENLTLTGVAAINGTGNAANNSLTGNKAANILTGGKGRDMMTGGTGDDTFDFNSALDSAVGSKHDVIKDFAHLADKIDLKTIDANGAGAGNGVFTLLTLDGQAFGNVAGQLRFDTSGGTTIIEGDIDGNGVADFQIELLQAIALTVGDFNL